MRHRVSGKKFNRSTKQRLALFKSLAASLVENGYITTTQAKGRAVKSLMDKLISRAHPGNLASRRAIHAFFNHKGLTNKLVDQLAPQVKPNLGGYTRLIKLGKRRGDRTMMVKVEIVGIEPLVKAAAPKKSKKIAAKKSAGRIPSLKPLPTKAVTSRPQTAAKPIIQRTTSK